MAANDVIDSAIDPVARFDLIASAVADADVTVRTARGDLPTHTDGRTIWVSQCDAREDLRRSREAVLIQALVLRHGTLDRACLDRLGRPATTHRYFGYEVRRALTLGSPLPLVGLIADTTGDQQATPDSTAESLKWARSRLPSNPTPAHWGTLIPKSIRHDARSESGDLPTDRSAVEPAESAKPKDTAAQNDLADAAPERERTNMFTLMTRRIRKGNTGRRKGDGSGTLLDGWSSGAVYTHSAGRRMPPPPAPSECDQSTDGATLHPEWDVRRGAYRTDWCRVRESDVPQSHNVAVPEILADTQLRRGMARLARSLTWVHGQRAGDDIDLDAVIDRQVSRRSGHHRDHGVHIARLRVRPELTVMILMDASSSTADPVGDGRTVFDEQRSAATAIIDAMAAVGLSTAWWTFRSQGRQAVSVELVKTFDQPADYEMHARAAALRPSGFTRLGAAVRHAATAIDARAGAGHRLLIVLSDGVAFDHGYEGNHADSDARMAILEARNRQIGCLCLSVGVAQDNTRLRDTFGAHEYLRFSSWNALHGNMAPLLRTAIWASR